MSSPLRTLQRAVERGKFFRGRATQLGTHNPKDRSLLALRREAKRKDRP